MKEPIRLIVVEDDPQVCERFERTFGEAPEIEVLAWASTAAQAIAALETHKPDVLLVDLGLPDANGITLEEEMMKVRNLGRKSLEEVEQKLAALGLSLRLDD